MLGLSLVALFAFAAIAASSASALPEWGRCEEKAGGKYSDSNCTKIAKPLGSGHFEFRHGKELKPDKFSGENVGSGGVLTSEIKFCEDSKQPEFQSRRIPKKQCAEHEGEVKAPLGVTSIECTSEHNTGEAVGTNGVQNISVKFNGCKLLGTTACSNGTEEGEIVVNTLKGKLGYINKKEKKVGVLLEPAVKHGEFAKFICAGFLGIVVGVGNAKEGAWYEPETTGGFDGIISPITPVNTTTSKYEQVFTINKTTLENIPSKFEGQHRDLLENYAFNAEQPRYTSLWSPAAEEITNVNTSEEPGEIRA
jgi:hypothetical protein